MNLLTGVYSGKRVLITGHTGFKGSWLSIWLKELGAEVVGYALPPYTERDNFIQTGLQDHIEDIRGDIRNNQSLEKVFNTYSPDFVFHLAAQALVREGYQHPKDTFDVNIGGTVNLLENCRKCPSVKAIIIITSDKCYENKEWTWGYRENDPMGGFDPYSASKGCAELVTSSYRQSFFNPNRENPFPALSSVRAGNVIGGGGLVKGSNHTGLYPGPGKR
jgi:CDP-glucose 4,6-dehydratase